MFSRDISGCLGSKISMAIMDSHGCCHKQIHGYQWHGWQSIGGNGYLHINCYRWLSMPPLPRPVATRFFGSTDWVCVPSSTFHWIHGNAKRIWQPRLAKPPFSLFGLECPPPPISPIQTSPPETTGYPLGDESIIKKCSLVWIKLCVP